MSISNVAGLHLRQERGTLAVCGVQTLCRLACPLLRLLLWVYKHQRTKCQRNLGPSRGLGEDRVG